MSADLLDGLVPSFIDPGPFFQARTDHLVRHIQHPHLRKKIRGPAKVGIVTSGLADAVTQKRRPRGYRIRVHDGLLRLMHDVTEIVIARTEIISGAGAVVTPVDLTHDQAVEILKDLVTHYVLHQQWLGSIDLMATQVKRRSIASPDTFALGRQKLSVPYIIWMTDFVMAHELGHIVLNHVNNSTPSLQDQWNEEYQADDAGLLFVKYSIVADGEAEAEVKRLKFVQLHIALAILFEALALVVRVAHSLGKDWNKSHPPGDERYGRLRANQIKNGIPESAFTSCVVGMDPPDHVQNMFREIGSAVTL